MSVEKEIGSMSVREAGRRGARATLAKHGKEHFKRIGAMGRATQIARLGPEGYRLRMMERAKQGGARTSSTHNTDYYSELGRKGGEALKASVDPDYYRRIGRLSATTRLGTD